MNLHGRMELEMDSRFSHFQIIWGLGATFLEMYFKGTSLKETQNLCVLSVVQDQDHAPILVSSLK